MLILYMNFKLVLIRPHMFINLIINKHITAVGTKPHISKMITLQEKKKKQQHTFNVSFESSVVRAAM